jgi:hypothetical protein
VYGFTEQGFNRVTRATKLVEKELIPAATGRRGRYPIGGRSRIRVAKVKTGGITAASGATMGFGNVELCNVGTDRVAVPNGTVIEVSNAGGSIAVDRFILIDDGPRGPWVVVDKC